MAEPRLITRTYSWAPRALAVVGCALALLAAVPREASLTTKTPGVVLREAGDPASAEARVEPRLLQAQRQMPQGRRVYAGLGTGPRLHILATVEILQRLLAAELRPATVQAMPLVWFEPLLIQVMEPSAGQAAGPRYSPPLLPAIHERDHAIARHLLAPPLA